MTYPYLVGDFLSRATNVPTLEELMNLYAEELRRFGLNHWAYQAIPQEIRPDKPPVIVSNYPEAWVERYVEKSYHVVDPVISQGKACFEPFTWRSLEDRNTFNSSQREFFNEATEFNLGDGIGIAIHGRKQVHAMISMGAPEDTGDFGAFFQEYSQSIYLISLVFNNVAQDLVQADLIYKVGDIRLSPRESECLQWYAAGKSVPEIALILNLSESAVKLYLSNARGKFGVHSTTEAVVKAILGNFLTV